MDSLEHRTLGKEGHGAESTLLTEHICPRLHCRPRTSPEGLFTFQAASHPSCDRDRSVRTALVSCPCELGAPGESVGLRTVTLSSQGCLRCGFNLRCHEDPNPQIQQELWIPRGGAGTLGGTHGTAPTFFSSLSPAKWSPKSQGLLQVVQNQADTSLRHCGISSGSP